MSKTEYDPKKIIQVSMDKVVPNDYNAKDKDTAEYQTIVKSIKTKGLRGAVVVRNHPNPEFAGHYVIIDGEQRYTAAKELGYKELYVYNEGDVDEKEAKELTIWYQSQVPFSRVLEAYLVSSMVDEFGAEALELPYTDAQLEEFSDLANFDFDQYKDEEFKENLDGTMTFSVKLAKSDFEIVKGTLDVIIKDSPHKIDLAEALVQVMAGYAVDNQTEEEQ